MRKLIGMEIAIYVLMIWQRRNPIGNIMQSDFFEIWNSNIWNIYRKDLFDGKRKNHHVLNVIVMVRYMDQSIRVVGKIIGKLLFKMKNIKYAQKKLPLIKVK